MTPISRFAVVLVGLVLLARPAFAAPPTAAEQRFAEGQALLAREDVDGAAAAFVEAARAAPDRADYVERATLLRRVQGLRRVYEKGEPGPAWDRAAASLQSFYLQSDLPRLAVAVSRKAHDRQPSAETAGRLAEALLANGENADVTIAVAPYTGTSPLLATYHAIALARLGLKEEAARLIDRATPAEDAAPTELYERARAFALIGRADGAIALLVACFERTPPVALAALRERAPKEKDFASLSASPAFAKALRTESKVAETCSGGSSCAGCPNRGSCRGAKK